MTRYYPAYLDLTGRRCVVIGAGAVAERKVLQLLASGADVTLVSPTATPELERLANERNLRWVRRAYAPGDLAGAMLAIAATDDESVNRLVHEEAEREKTLLNVVDVTPLCGFIAPSVVERGPVTVAISTAGTSPALARKLRELMSGAQDPRHAVADHAVTDHPLTDHPVTETEEPFCRCMEWADAAEVLSEVRSELQARNAAVPPEAWQAAMDDRLLELVEQGNDKEARERLLDTLLSAAKS